MSVSTAYPAPPGGIELTRRGGELRILPAGGHNNEPSVGGDQIGHQQAQASVAAPPVGGAPVDQPAAQPEPRVPASRSPFRNQSVWRAIAGAFVGGLAGGALLNGKKPSYNIEITNGPAPSPSSTIPGFSKWPALAPESAIGNSTTAKLPQQFSGSPDESFVKNGSLQIAQSLYHDYGTARTYLSQSTRFAALLNEIEQNHTISLQPSPIVSVINPRASLFSKPTTVTWDSNVGRRVERAAINGQVPECGHQSPAVELIRQLYTTFGMRQYPTYAKLLQCIGDLFHGNQDAVRVNSLVTNGLNPLNELAAQFGHKPVFAHNVTEHTSCKPSVAPLTEEIAASRPYLRDSRRAACEAIPGPADARGVKDFVDDERPVELSHSEIHTLSQLKRQSLDLEFRAAQAAHFNGTSPLAFAKENTDIRLDVAAFLTQIQNRVAEAPNPFFDVRRRLVPDQPAIAAGPTAAPQSAIRSANVTPQSAAEAEQKAAPAPSRKLHTFTLSR